MNNTTEELKKYAPIQEVQNEAMQDFQKMMQEKKNLSSEYTYGRMTDAEFIEERKKRSQMGIASWFGWDNNYTSILIARVLNKNGYQSNAGSVSCIFGKQEEYVQAINNALLLISSI